jgi:hypothetical protein
MYVSLQSLPLWLIEPVRDQVFNLDVALGYAGLSRRWLGDAYPFEDDEPVYREMYTDALCALAAKSLTTCHQTLYNADSLTYFALAVYMLQKQGWDFSSRFGVKVADTVQPNTNDGDSNASTDR